MIKTNPGWSWQFVLAGALATGGVLHFCGSRATAQITLDGSVGQEKTLDGPNYVIRQADGRTVGTNLFHSFRIFKLLNADDVATFESAGITNILSRVTGGSDSTINGTIRSRSTANIFLINPAGIIFGPNARLDIGGSFVGTTANAIRFPNGGEFSMNSQVDPGNSLLAVNPSALFFNQTPAGAIVNQSRSLDPTDPNTLEGLRVPDGRSLLLVGGDIKVEGGFIQAPGGRLELGGLAAPGEVELKVLRDNILGLGFPDGIARADISLTNQAELSASILNGGSEDAGIVIVRGNKVSLDHSNIFSQILAAGQGNAGGILIEAGSLSLVKESRIASSSFGSGNAGAIFIEVDGSVSLSDTSSIQSNVEFGATNSIGGIVSITAGSLSLLSGSQVQTIVRGNENGQQPGQGDAGSIFIDTSDTITIDGVGFLDGQPFASAIFSSVGRGARGKAGDIQISTRDLSLSNSGRIDTSLGTSSLGGDGTVGTAGSIFIKATDSVSLTSGATIRTVIEQGAQESRGGSSPFYGNVINALLGKGGDVTGTILISTGSLSLKDGSVLNTSTFGDGNAGAVVVVARDDVSLKGGAIGSIVGEQATGNAGAILMSVGSLSIASTSDYDAGLTTETLGQGNAGLIYVEADKDISIRNESGTESGIASRVSEGSTYDSGAIILKARSLFLRDEGAKVTVNNQGSGVAGGIEITMREDIILRDKGEISATAYSGSGAEVYLTSGDFLVLVSGSKVTTEAGQNTNFGDGGNVFIDTRYVIAAPFNDNNIDANAFLGSGGNIRVNASRLYDIQKREVASLQSNDITASSDFGLNGIVSTTGLNIDPTQGLSNLPAEAVDPTRLIAETCAPRGGITERQKNQFIVTNRGGLPPDPNAAFPGEAVVTDQGTPNQQNNQPNSPHSTNSASSPPVATASPQQQQNQPDSPGSSNSTSATPTAIASPQPPENQPNNPGSTNPASSPPVATASPQQQQNQPDSPGSTNSTSAMPTVSASPQQPIVEAQGWVFDKNGDIEFTNEAPTVIPNRSELTPASTCNGLSTQP